MAAQTSTNYPNQAVVRGGSPYSFDNETLLQDAARVADLAQYTVMAQVASSGKWVPLTDVDPTLATAYMTCGAVGGTQAEFAAVADGSFGLSVDGVAIAVSALDFTDLPSVLDTRATAVCGANGANLGAWQAVTDASVSVTINGAVTTKTAINCSGITTLDDLEDVLNNAFLGEDIEWLYDDVGDVFSYQNKTTGATSTLTVLSTGGAGTDVSGAGFLNGTGATLTQGTGHDGYYAQCADVINHAALGRFICTFDGDEFRFSSPTPGVNGAVTVLIAGVGGTDISGAGFLNGLTGTGTATAGSGADGSDLPTGIFWGDAVATADLVAGDVTGQRIMVGGQGVVLDENQITLENSLTMASVVVARAETIESTLRGRGIYMQATRDISSYQA